MTSTPDLEALLERLKRSSELDWVVLHIEAAAAIRELRAQVDLGHDNYRMMQDDYLKARAELEAAKKDAERLAWIATNCYGVRSPRDARQNMFCWSRGDVEELRRRIDAALAAREGP